MTSAVVPVRTVIEVAVTTPEVLLSSVFRTEAARVVSFIVTASFPNPVIPEDA